MLEEARGEATLTAEREAADPAPGFRLTLESGERRVVPGAVLEIDGVITSTGSSSLDFCPDRPHPLKLGARAYALPPEPGDGAALTDRAPALETRGTVATPLLHGGESGRFDLSIPTHDLAPGRYVLVLDLVIEGRCWFADRGHQPVQVGLTCAPSEAPEPARAEEFRYDIVLEACPDRAGAVVIAGTITNTGTNTLAFDTDGDDQVRIGAKVYAARPGLDWPEVTALAPAIEPRGTVDAALLRTGESARFEIRLPCPPPASDGYLAVVDLVIENAFWFADVGQVPGRILIDPGLWAPGA